MAQQNVLLLVSLIGELLLKNGAETYRVEETVRKIGAAYNFVTTEVFALPTGLFISLEDKDGQSWTRIKRIKHQTTNLQKVSMVNNLSRQIADGQVEVNQALMELRRIEDHVDGYPAIVSYLAAGVGGITFSYLVYGLRLELIPAFIGALLLEAWIRSNNINNFVAEVLSGVIAATVGVISNYFYPILDYNVVILGIIIILVPGVSITNAARDVIAGDSLSGVVRGMNALLTALAIAVGVASILGIKILI